MSDRATRSRPVQSLSRRTSAPPVLLAPFALLLAVVVVPAAAPAPAAHGEKTVRFAGVAVQVPSDWPV